MRKEELDALSQFLAEPSPEPRLRQFQMFYVGEILYLVSLLMIPAGWLPNPTAFKDLPDPSRFQLNTIFTPTGCPARRRRSGSSSSEPGGGEKT